MLYLEDRESNEDKSRGVFRIMSNIYDEAFLRKQLMAIFAKSSIIDV